MHEIGVQLGGRDHFERQCFRGLCNFVRRLRPDWRLRVDHEIKPEDLAGDSPGLIATARDRETSRAIQRSGIPAVNLSARFVDPYLPQVRLDDRAIGRIAAEHLHQCGYRRFAYFGIMLTHDASQQRRAGFISGLEALGYSLDDLVVDVGRWRSGDADDSDAALLAEALAADRTPIGCFAFEDERGRAVLDACAQRQIDVPRRVGLVGAGNDEYICETSFPAITSIDINQYARGQEAARVLAMLMDGEEVAMPLPPVAPGGLILRGSTGVARTDDPMVDRALAFINDHARREINVEDVVDHVKSNRRTLERRFRAALGLSPHQQIVTARIEHVKQLLLTTDLGTAGIAEASGFRYRAHLSTVFRKMTGQTMMDYRNRPTAGR